MTGCTPIESLVRRCNNGATFTYLAFFTELALWLKALIALVMVYGASYILTKPSRLPGEETEY